MELRIKKIMSNIFKVPENEITGSTSNKNTEAWDSLNHMQLIAALEDEFDIMFDADEIVKLVNFEIVKRTLNAKGIG